MMGNRGQKRPEAIDGLPEEKRSCRPESSSSSVQTLSTNTTNLNHDRDMETASSASGSSRSESEADRDSLYGSCDSDELSDAEQRRNRNTLRDYQRLQSSGNHVKFKTVLSTLSGNVGESGQLAALTELCELLSFCMDGSFSSLMADSLSPILIKLAKHESNPDIMLLSIRALTYLCDAHPRSSAFVVRHDGVTALCERLMAVEYLDVAEQCLQALEKISREQPLACLQSGAIMAVLTYIDFFSTSLQRVSLATVVNICKKLPSECPSPFMEAVPKLCNLLQYEDIQLVEAVASCLIKIAERVCHSSDMLDELSKHGLIQQATHLIDLNRHTTLCRPIYTGLIGLLVKLASGSMTAVRTLFELNISSILKDILSTYNLSHGVPSSPTVDGYSNQAHEVLKLMNELLPVIARNQDAQLALAKEAFLANHPDLLQKFGMDLLPVLIQVVNSGGDLNNCYGCLTVINKLIYFSKSNMLLELLKSANISSFLAGIFSRKDHHVIMTALQIVDNILQKHADVFVRPFVKEGVFFAIDALLVPENGSHFMFSMFNGIQLSNDSSSRSAARDVRRCLCYLFETGPSPSASESLSCRLEVDSVQSLAKDINTSYFATTPSHIENGLTDLLQKLKASSSALADLVKMSKYDVSCMTNEEEFCCALHQIMLLLYGTDPVSTFEFVESGIVKSLVNFLFDDQSLEGKFNITGAVHQPHIAEKRLEVFGRLFWTPSDLALNRFSLSPLISKLQNALSSVENFPVILNSVSKQRNSYATVPLKRCTSYQCLKVQFVRGEGEKYLSDYSEDVVTVDSFSSFNEIERRLLPKVGVKRSKQVKPVKKALNGSVCSSPSDSSLSEYKNLDLLESDGLLPNVHAVQDEKPNLSQSVPGEASNLGQITTELTSLSESHAILMEQEQNTSSQEDGSMSTECPESCSYEDSSPKLLFYLEDELLDKALTVYQAIFQRKSKSENEMITATTFWSQVYRVTYRRASKEKETNTQHPDDQISCSSASGKAGSSSLYTPLFSCIPVSKLASVVEKSSSTYDILLLLRILERMNRYRFHLTSRERINAFAEGRIDSMDNVEVEIDALQNEFVNCRLTEKLELQMRDALAVSTGGMLPWCIQLMSSCPFLFSSEGRCKYFRLAAFGKRQVQPQLSSNSHSGSVSSRHQNNATSPRKKFLVYRDQILESAAKMMDLHARQKAVLEVEYDEEVGTGLGPTLEFYTLVSYEFQRPGLCMWRGDHMPFASMEGVETEGSRIVASDFGLFPRPWSSTMSVSSGIEFSEVVKKFVLLGQVVAKTLQDGRVLDMPFSKAFYKLILGQDLTLYDIQSFDAELGRALIELQALAQRIKYLESSGKKSMHRYKSCLRNTSIEDLFLDFTLPGYPDYVLTSEAGVEMVNAMNLEDYVALVVDATVNSGILRQVDAFRSGFNQVFPISHLQIFTEEELEHLLCGEREIWNSSELSDHVKFDHGYTASSPPIINLLEIIKELNCEQQKAFLRFVTGAPRLPPGGLSSLSPKLTIVRKHCGTLVDADLPSVMTCANYLKLPPYSSKEIMKEKLLYAITEGQGSFHLS